MTTDEFKNTCYRKMGMIKERIGGRKVYIWGAGTGGGIIESVCREQGISIVGFCDKKSDEIKEYLGYPVLPLEKMQPDKCYLIISFMSFEYDMLDWINKIGYTCNDCFYINESEGYKYNKEDIVYRGCRIGRYTYGYEGLLKYRPTAVIGRYCSFGPDAHIVNNHPMECVTTHPFIDHPFFYGWDEYESRHKYMYQYGKHFQNADYEKSPLRNNREVVIGNDVWIGANAIILPGVKIGNGAVIAAGAVVVKDVDAYAVVGGVPAKVLKYRFAKKDIELLEQVKWWEWEMEDIEKNIELFYQPEKFLHEIRRM